jgi:hypothetical protein
VARPEEFMNPFGRNPMLDMARISIPKNPTLADTMYDRVVEAIAEFEKELDADHEVGARLTNFGASFTVTIENVGYHNPYLFKIYGVTLEGHRCTLIQHVSQLSILLIAVPAVHKPARRVGFLRDDASAPDSNTAEEDSAG